MATGTGVGTDQLFFPKCDMGGTAATSPLDNLRCLERLLDVTYSSVCCSLNAGTLPILVRVPLIFPDDEESQSRVSDPVDPSAVSSRVSGSVHCMGSGSSERLADIFGRKPASYSRHSLSESVAQLPPPRESRRMYSGHNIVTPPRCSCTRVDTKGKPSRRFSSTFLSRNNSGERASAFLDTQGRDSSGFCLACTSVDTDVKG